MDNLDWVLFLVMVIIFALVFFLEPFNTDTYWPDKETTNKGTEFCSKTGHGFYPDPITLEFRCTKGYDIIYENEEFKKVD